MLTVGVGGVGREGIWEVNLFNLPFNFSSKPKTALKNQVYELRKATEKNVNISSIVSHNS